MRSSRFGNTTEAKPVSTIEFTSLDMFLFFAIIGIGMAVRLWYFSLPVGPDEAFTYLHYAKQPWLIGLGKYDLPNNHILNTLSIHAARTIWGDSMVALRLPSIIAGCATIVATALLAREVSKAADLEPALDRVLWISSALFAAFSYPLIVYSIQARGYSLQTFFFLVSAIAAIRLVSEPLRRWSFLFAASTALAFFAVPTHLYGAAALGLWLVVCMIIGVSQWPELRRMVVKAATKSIGWTAFLYVPAIVFVAINGTKIEGAEPAGKLAGSISIRAKELLAYWTQAHTPTFVMWAFAGFAAVIFFGVLSFHRVGRLALLLVCLFLGPAIVFYVMKRPAPFTRVWTYGLPVLFVFAAFGWCYACRFLPLAARAIGAGVVVFAPLILAMHTGLRTASADLVSQKPRSARVAYDYLAFNLQAGDHVAMENMFYDEFKFIALTRKDPAFRLEPLLRPSEGRLAVFQQRGRIIQKENPLDAKIAGRVLLIETEPDGSDEMKKWLKRYLKPGESVKETSVTVLTGNSPGEGIRVIEFKRD